MEMITSTSYQQKGGPISRIYMNLTSGAETEDSSLVFDARTQCGRWAVRIGDTLLEARLTIHAEKIHRFPSHSSLPNR